MKAVIYHADTYLADKFPKDTYKQLTLGLKKNLKTFNIPLIHITVTGHEGWGDENYFYDGDPADAMYNREKFFLEFLKTCPDDIYWFTEPDARLHEMFPPLTADLALLRRNDTVAISPWWRLAKKSSVPFFEEVLKHFDMERKGWHGDSAAYAKVWEVIGKPDLGLYNWNGITFDFRKYKLYTRRNSPYSRQWKSEKKIELLPK
jgi:hypothetical protein